MIICIAFNAILSASSIAGGVVVDGVGDEANTTCNNTISLLTPNGVSSIFFFSFLIVYSEWSVC